MQNRDGEHQWILMQRNKKKRIWYWYRSLNKRVTGEDKEDMIEELDSRWSSKDDGEEEQRSG